jgi:nitrous oxidase accessory protein
VSAARRAPRERARQARALAAAALLATACTGAREPLAPAAASARGPARPAQCRELAAGAALQAEVDAAPAGGALCLAPGEYAGPLRIAAPLTLWGGRGAVIRSGGSGTTIRMQGRAALLGVTIDGSGDRFERLDAAVHVSGSGGRVEGIEIRNAMFGILIEKADGVRVAGNRIAGDPALPLGLRGDGIRLWETYDSTVEDNVLRDSRDVVLWYASRNRVAGNRVEAGRYGAHLMYSHQNEIVGNRFVGNVTGLFVMYSRDVLVQDNVFADSGGAAGIGLGLKESGDVRVLRNLFVGDSVGLYVDASPLWPDDRNLFEGNVFRLNDVAVSFLGPTARNEFRGNGFRDSQVQVRVEGGGDALAALWRANAFDDYAGYDLDGDGTGDVPYELRSLASELVATRPALAFYRGTLAFALAEAIGRSVPLFEARLVLSDPQPRMTRVEWEEP